MKRFSEYVHRVGVRRAAKIFGVSDKTLRSWLRSGVPKTKRKSVFAQTEVGTFIERFGYTQSAQLFKIKPSTAKRWSTSGVPETRLAYAASSVKSFAETMFRMPELPASDLARPVRSAPLLPGEILPKKPPPEVEPTFFEDEVIHTDRYMGEQTWVPVQKAAADVSTEQVQDLAIFYWQNSGRAWVALWFVLFRYIPFNPIYKGELVKKQGTWVEWGHLRTKAATTERGIKMAVAEQMATIHNAAASRVIYMEGIQVSTFDVLE